MVRKKFFITFLSISVSLIFFNTLYAASYVMTDNSAPYVGADSLFYGTEYTDISAGWTVRDTTAIRINNDNDTWVEYTASLVTGNWNIGLNVKNSGNLGANPTSWYPYFEISTSNGKTIQIVASDMEIFSGYINLDVYSDDAFTIRYTWINDAADYSYTPPLDANIYIDSAFFDRIGDVTPVPLPATIALFASGLLGLLGIRRNQR